MSVIVGGSVCVVCDGCSVCGAGRNDGCDGLGESKGIGVGIAVCEETGGGEKIGDENNGDFWGISNPRVCSGVGFEVTGTVSIDRKAIPSTPGTVLAKFPRLKALLRKVESSSSTSALLFPTE